MRTAKVSLENKTAIVTYDPQKATVAQMIAAVEKAGYGARVKPG